MSRNIACLLPLLISFFVNINAARIPNVSAKRNFTERALSFTYEPIKTGYVAFGDSYAAGIGAGSTSWDGCRLGKNSYPNQLDIWVDSLQSGVDYQNLPCSGAVITEVLEGGKKSQIDAWKDPGKADRATLSIGGNDIGFYEVLTACVLRLEQGLAGVCSDQIDKAYRIMRSAEFNNNLNNALHQIIVKSGRSDFRIIQTGYPAFFNVDTDYCDLTTFYFWQPGHHGINRNSPWGDWEYLVKSKRLQLNNLVVDLNRQLVTIIEGVNKEYPEPRVIFADPNPAFDGHRFCEEGIKEPDPNNQDNWFFLFSWPDVLSPGHDSVDSEEGLTPLRVQDSITCSTTHDWADLALCGLEKAGIARNADVGMTLLPEVQLPDGTNVSTSEIAFWKATNYAKMFHPRSSGQTAYRDLVRRVW